MQTTALNTAHITEPTLAPITTLEANPFRLMMEPEAVLRAMARSTDLRGLQHHKYRPLDRPWIPFASAKKSVEGLTSPRNAH